ncbi:MAG TPA: hypothetical protein DIW61_01285 [Candidatus Aminicenantes bacterium]|nr:hypothetical protein [Candidatus Aminicenantes bacterium]
MSVGRQAVPIRAVDVPIRWHEGMSIYASEPFLRAFGDEYGWIGGVGADDRLRCVLPFTIVRMAHVRMARFRIETIPVVEDFGVQEERVFLESAMGLLRAKGADLVIPASTNTVFRTFPKGAIAAPYSSYIIDLTVPLELLWGNISHKYRKDIRGAEKKGVTIVKGLDRLDAAYEIILGTFKRSRLPFISYKVFRKNHLDLAPHMELMIAEHEGIPQSCTSFHFSKYSAYSVHGGSILGAVPGAMKSLQWEAIKSFRELGVRRFDLLGARVDPAKGSKQEGILLFKRYFGGRPTEGYMWKYHLRPLKSAVYSLAVRVLRGGDIVDAERHKLKSDPSPADC